MRLTRTRGFNRYAQRDFDQERADLNEGYHNYAQETETNINDVLTSDVYTLEQKKQFLRAAKIDLMQKSQDYSEKMQQINEEEAQHLMDSWLIHTVVYTMRHCRNPIRHRPTTAEQLQRKVLTTNMLLATNSPMICEKGYLLCQ